MDKLTGKLTPIGGLSGGLTIPRSSAETYEGEYVVTPKAYEEQVLETANKLMLDNVSVLRVPYFETSNTSGTTVYIANEV